MDNDDEFSQAVERSFGVVERKEGSAARDLPAMPVIDVSPRPAKNVLLAAAGIGVLAAAAVGIGVSLYTSRAKAGDEPGGASGDGPTDDADDDVIDDATDDNNDINDDAARPLPKPIPGIGEGWWSRVPSLPTADEVEDFDVDLVNNWGSTPKDLRPLFALMEGVSQIRGSGRIFALISFREAGFKAGAHNTDEIETNASRRAYKNARDRNRPLKYGDASAEFGSGGLFGALAPYFLWTGVQAMKGAAPLLSSPPEVMFIPRVAAFGAAVYMRRIITYYRIDDHADIKVGWARPTLLKKGRGNEMYKEVRTRFFADAGRLGLNLGDTTTIPTSLSGEDWPGVASVFAKLTKIDPKETQET